MLFYDNYDKFEVIFNKIITREYKLTILLYL